MTNVIPLGNVTYLDISADQVLDQARGKCPDGVITIGYDVEGDLYFASSIADGGTVLWLLEQCKLGLLDSCD